ncbi:DUF7856 family protein [Haloarchaeobius iranensis]|uniref:Uncharacterized protein n=1 Tax=Haloarchaeobius iranensis TaxID=996166 RepID=A0A1G9SI41_9EURY|nr:hypothetical protein [Haloarchaeobius iranensis]SDM35143.1 hypothetical protein SAMN05192554_101204 [Haloarchaeobius iranensis]
MKVRYGAWSATGTAVDLRKRGLTAETVLRAVRADGAVGTGTSTQDRGPTLRIECPAPGPVHESLGVVGSGGAVCTRSALATVARQRGLTPPQADRIEALERELAAVGTDDGAADERQRARKRVSEVGTREAALRERVASLRGALRERRELGEPTGALERELREAARELTEVETDRIAAEEALAAARRAARDARDARERRLAIEDDLANARRAARAWLVTRVEDEFVEALAAMPGPAVPGETPGTYEGDAVTAALAVVGVADVAAPVVLSCERFPSAGAAAAALDAPVLTV